MSQSIQIVALCLALIGGVQNQNADTPIITCCLSASATQRPTCQGTTTPKPAPVCPFASTPASAEPQTKPTEQPTSNNNPTSSTPTGRQPDTNKGDQPRPSYVLPWMPNYPGIPNMPMYPPYPLLGNYMPIVEDPTTGQRYYVMRNPNLPTNKYSQILNIYAPEMNPGYYVVPPTEPPANNGTSPANNVTSTAKSADKS